MFDLSNTWTLDSHDAWEEAAGGRWELGGGRPAANAMPGVVKKILYTSPFVRVILATPVEKFNVRLI